uniref:Family with sequence similarity 81 member B n=1 Tax=Naja naja TaxID=35670 RepID=A0A8C6V9S8_NAJNA
AEAGVDVKNGSSPRPTAALSQCPNHTSHCLDAVIKNLLLIFYFSRMIPLDRTPSQPFLPAIPNVSGSRVNSLEDRLSNQERTTAVLLDQAFRIKDGVVSYLQGNKNFQQGEAAAHQLLENHIQTITSVVKKLSHDIEELERQIKARDEVTSGTNFAVQSLDHKQMQGVGDLRGRVARCDASIAKLSGDINISRHEISKLEKEIHAVQSSLDNYMNNIEMKVLRFPSIIAQIVCLKKNRSHQTNLITFFGRVAILVD